MERLKFSANLGFLWSELSLLEAIPAAKLAGFDAVECHWPYDVPAADVHAVLAKTGLVMLGLNTRRGDVAAGDMGLSAVPGKEQAARDAIDEALAYAIAIGASNIHVMAGHASGAAAHDAFLRNLSYACQRAEPHGVTILIEPLNKYDAPNYFLKTTAQAVEIINQVGAKNLKLMFDCYHVQLMEGDLTNRLTSLLPLIGHIQFAGVPARGRPDQGELNYAHIFSHIRELGYKVPLGAEYRTNGRTEDTLEWLVLPY